MFEKTITFSPAFDKRDPDPAKDSGVHGVDLKFLLKGPLGATQFVLFTNWPLPGSGTNLREPQPADLGYHSPVPQYEGQDHTEDCDVLGDGGCYYDGSGFLAEAVFEALLKEGSEGVWRLLEEEYNLLFRSQVKAEGSEP